MENNVIITDRDREFIRISCEIANENIDRGGGPFGAVIVHNDEIVSTGANSVTLDNDPTAHAEVNAIRRACELKGNFKLDDCVVYSSCEPCPMCLSALYWAGVKRVYYANTKHEAACANFDDSFIYEEIEKQHLERSIPCVHVHDEHANDHFRKWMEKTDKTPY